MKLPVGRATTRRFTCDDVEEHLDAYFDDALDAAGRRAFAQHVVSCGQCNALVRDERVMRRRLRAAGPATDSAAVDRHASVVANLLAMAPAPDSGAPQPRPAPKRCPHTLRADAPAQYERHKRGPAAGFLALAGVIAFALATVWASPQRRAPQPASPTQVARSDSAYDDEYRSVRIESTPGSGLPGAASSTRQAGELPGVIHGSGY